jgi:hypothetical protein
MFMLRNDIWQISRGTLLPRELPVNLPCNEQGLVPGRASLCFLFFLRVARLDVLDGWLNPESEATAPMQDQRHIAGIL